MVVVGIGVAGGHVEGPVRVAAVSPAPVAAAAAPSAAVARVVPAEAAATNNRSARIVGREHGTDGLMGRLPFGIPGDSPLKWADRVDRFTIDDTVLGWAGSAPVEPRGVRPYAR